MAVSVFLGGVHTSRRVAIDVERFCTSEATSQTQRGNDIDVRDRPSLGANAARVRAFEVSLFRRKIPSAQTPQASRAPRACIKGLPRGLNSMPLPQRG